MTADLSNRNDTMTPSLVIRLRNGDPSAADLLNDLYRDALLRFCFGYLHRQDEAEDAVQDVCYKVLSASQPPPDHFRPWIYRMARNHCLNLLRARGRRRDRAGLPDASQVHEMITGNLTRLVRDERKARLSELVANLSPEHQETLRLRYVEELSRSEIAEVLEISESVVKSRLFEGLKQLREHTSLLEERDATGG